MNRYFWQRFIGSLFIAFGSLQLSRLVFYTNLSEYFEASIEETINAFLLGFQFDAVCIAYLLGPFFIFLPFAGSKAQLTISKWYFVVVLGGMNFLNCVDAEFFKFTARRSTDDLFEFAFLSNDIVNIAPNLVRHFWYLLVAFAHISLASLFSINRVMANVNDYRPSLLQKGLGLSFSLLLLVFFARGGLHPIPLSIIDASKIDPPHLNSVVLSTPFTMIKTLGKPELETFNYHRSETANIEPLCYPNTSSLSGRLKGHNTIILIVESLSTEYVGALNNLGVTYTPFIDSLCKTALVFKKGHANGHRSIEGIAAISASIPTLMYEPFVTSRYAENNISSLASILGQEGYFCSFVHGGNKNSMNFESFSSQAEFDVFYDRDDYPYPNRHYDGVWGVSDHHMLNQCVKMYSEYSQPFFSTVFTLSSHHPYTIPEGYKNRFPKGTLPIHESIGYADQSLREFFLKASKTNWYNNTLFVITADHTSLSEHRQFQTRTGSLRIPIIFYKPNDTLISGINQKVVQQIDIMPTILDLLGYEKPFFAFGKSAFHNSDEGTAIAFKNDQYQLLKSDQLICFDGKNVNFVYDVRKDGLLQHNLVNNTQVDYSSNLAHLKASIQNYSIALNNNLMTFEAWSKQHP